MIDNEQQRIDFCVQQKLEGKDYTHIREGLRAEGYTDKEIQSIIRKTDDIVLEHITNPDEKQSIFEKLLDNNVIGLGLILLGLIVFLVTHTYTEGKLLVIWYGPVIAGIGFWLMRGRKTSTGKKKLAQPRPSEFFKSKYDRWRE